MTNNRKVAVSENLASNAREGQVIKLRISHIFGQVNLLEIKDNGQKERYSFRWLTGFIVPLLTLIILAAGIVVKNRGSLLAFIAEFAIAGDLIYLLY